MRSTARSNDAARALSLWSARPGSGRHDCLASSWRRWATRPRCSLASASPMARDHVSPRQRRRVGGRRRGASGREDRRDTRGESDAEVVARQIGAALGLADGQTTKQDTFWAFRRLVETLARRLPWPSSTTCRESRRSSTCSSIWSARSATLPCSLPSSPAPSFMACDPGGSRVSRTQPGRARAIVCARVEVAGRSPRERRDPDVRARIAIEANGNPLFAEQMLVYALEHGGRLEAPPIQPCFGQNRRPRAGRAESSRRRPSSGRSSGWRQSKSSCRSRRGGRCRGNSRRCERTSSAHKPHHSFRMRFGSATSSYAMPPTPRSRKRPRPPPRTIRHASRPARRAGRDHRLPPRAGAPLSPGARPADDYGRDSAGGPRNGSGSRAKGRWRRGTTSRRPASSRERSGSSRRRSPASRSARRAGEGAPWTGSDAEAVEVFDAIEVAPLGDSRAEVRAALRRALARASSTRSMSTSWSGTLVRRRRFETLGDSLGRTRPGPSSTARRCSAASSASPERSNARSTMGSGLAASGSLDWANDCRISTVRAARRWTRTSRGCREELGRRRSDVLNYAGPLLASGATMRPRANRSRVRWSCGARRGRSRRGDGLARGHLIELLSQDWPAAERNLRAHCHHGRLPAGTATWPPTSRFCAQSRDDEAEEAGGARRWLPRGMWSRRRSGGWLGRSCGRGRAGR